MVDEKDAGDGMDRRSWVKLGLAAAAAGAAVAAGATLVGPLLAPPPTQGVVEDRLIYTRFPTDQWWNPRAGQPIRVTDFGEWAGATGQWRAELKGGVYEPGTGLPVLAIRVKRDDAVFTAPPASAYNLPPGFSLYYDDPDRDIRIVVVYDRCAHLCCYPGWQVVKDPPPPRNYIAPAPTYEIYGLDPIYCVCHSSQFDPMALTEDVRGELRYVGPRRVHGPSTRAIPVVPVKAVDDVLIGGTSDWRWYLYCGV